MDEVEILSLWDPHMAIADKPGFSDSSFNHYRFHADIYDKVDAALAHAEANHNPDIIIVGGDCAENEASAVGTQDATDEVVANIQALNGKITTVFPGVPLYWMFGNWDLYFCTLAEFVAAVNYGTIDHDGGSGDGVGAKRYYSFDKNGAHFIVLDINCKVDGSHYDGYSLGDPPPGLRSWLISDAQIAWLQTDLTNHSSVPTVVFIHPHVIMGPNQYAAHYKWTWGDEYEKTLTFAATNSADAIRAVLENYGNVVLVCSGHYHPSQVPWSRNKIKYASFRGMILGEDSTEDGETNNCYGIITVKTTEGGDAKVAGEYEESTNIAYRRKLLI